MNIEADGALDGELAALEQQIEQLTKECDEMKSRAEAAEARCEEMREALEPFGCETCNGSEVFTFECQGCITGEGECTCANEQPSPCPQCQVIPDIKAQYDARKHALSDQCGQSWLSPEKKKVLVDALEGWSKYFQADWPKHSDDHEDHAEMFTKAWYAMEKALEACK